MFRFKYPDPKEDNQIVIENVDHEIIVMCWLEEHSKGYWIEKNKNPFDMCTYSLLENDHRISSGDVHWMYMKDFVRMMNIEIRNNIIEEDESQDF